MVGDLEANLEALKAQLRKARYPVHELDMRGLMEGWPTSVLPILHYIFLDMSPHFRNYLSEHGFTLRSKSDLRFVESVYRIFREHLRYSPALTVSQFFSVGFAERKVLMCKDALCAVQRSHNELLRLKPRGVGTVVCARRHPAYAAGNGEKATNAENGPSVGANSDDNNTYSDDLEDERYTPRPLPPQQIPFDAVDRGLGGSELAETCSRDGAQGATTIANSAAGIRELLQDIRMSLDLRFEQLEARVEAHIAESSARISLLEGDVRILGARLDGHIGSMVASSAPPQVASSALLPPTKNFSVASASETQMDVSKVPSTDSQLFMGWRSAQPMVAWNKEAAVISRDMKSAVAAKDIISDVSPAIGAVSVAKGKTGVDLCQDTKDLVDRLTAKFKDTQLLLSKAHELVTSPAVAAASGSYAHSPETASASLLAPCSIGTSAPRSNGSVTLGRGIAVGHCGNDVQMHADDFSAVSVQLAVERRKADSVCG